MKTIFITGNSRGLGLELTKALLRNPEYTIVSCSRTMSGDLESLINQYGDRLKWYEIDLAEVGSVEKKAQEMLQGVAVDIFIDNAAMLYKSLVVKFDYPQLENMMKINLLAPMILTKVVINNFLRNRRKGVILHYSSICARKGFDGLSMIAATKGGIEAFSRSIAHEYGGKGIRSNVISIGILDTGMSDTVNSRQREEIVSMSDLNIITDTESVFALSEYLISDRSSAVTSQVFHVNAGII